MNSRMTESDKESMASLRINRIIFYIFLQTVEFTGLPDNEIL